MTKKRTIMAIDLGASNGRCVLGEWDGKVLNGREILRFPNGPIETADGRLWWDIPFIFNKIKEALRICAAEGCAPECIGIDSWAQDFGLIDRNGLPLTMTRCYRDTYTQELYDRFMAEKGSQWLFDRTGTRPFNGSTLFQLASLRQQAPSITSAASQLLYVPGLLNYFFSGVPTCDCTLSSFSGIYDNRRRCWNEEIIRHFDLPAVLPEVLIPGQIIGELSENIALDCGCRPKIALTAGHDTASALYAAPDADDPETLLISSGTWSMMMCTTGGIVELDAENDPFSNGLGARGETIMTRGMTGLWIFQQCKKRWEMEGRFPGYAALEQYAAEHPAESYFDVDAPELSRVTDMESTIARLCRENGFAAPETPHEYYNTILNSLAITYAGAVKRFGELTGTPKKRIRLLSGGSKDPTLQALTRRHTGCEVVTGPVEASCVGNMMLQLTAIGECAHGERVPVARDF
ncbi:MAG: hypothetical protein E7463_14515 [Ruminococcaceae bacterium]|nr:hypothetical protein [Oscillospiraceae bacterium]